MKFEPKKIAMGLGAAFVVLAVWNDPQEAGNSTGEFLGDATSFVGDAFDKATEFAEAVIE